MVRRADVLWAMLGSADLTRHHLDGFNLDADVALEADLDTPLAQELVNHFETLWQNDPVALRTPEPQRSATFGAAGRRRSGCGTSM